jgi:hypothetical protein
MPLVGRIGPWTLGEGTDELRTEATAAPAGDTVGITPVTTKVPTDAARTASASVVRRGRCPHRASTVCSDRSFDTEPSPFYTPGRRCVAG